MAILVIGNGFDIAHGLNTKYSHFLEFIKMYRAGTCSIAKDDKLRSELNDFIKEIRSRHDPAAEEAKALLAQDNCLLDYFLHHQEELQNKGKDGWIDFESEISAIIQYFEAAREEEKSGIKSFSPTVSREIVPFFHSRYTPNQGNERITITPGFVEYMANNLYSNLNALTRLFEFYLTDYVEKTNVTLRIPEIEKLKKDITHVLSFNYTDTYQRLYGDENTKYSYIHGKAEEVSSLGKCRLVIGIDEYLEDDRRDLDNAFIWFKKFYQRIYKETSSSYFDWLNNHEKVYRIYNRDKTTELDIYFYGHSLYVTDKDVLRKLILHEGSKIHIFYHKKKTMATQISNLVKIIGEENLISMTRGCNRVIDFIPVGQENLC